MNSLRKIWVFSASQADLFARTGREYAGNALALAAIVTVIIASQGPLLAADDPSLVGLWEGSLDVNGIKLKLVLHIDADKDGGLKATLDSPDQGAKGIAIDTVQLDKSGKVVLESKLIKARFEGQLNKEGTIVGKWMQGGGSLPLSLKRLEKLSEPNRPQLPQPPFPYLEENVTFENKAASVQLTGTLTLPKGARRAPAALLLTGSGAQDRDETLQGHKPFLVLADYLTRRGVAVLRVDDRGVGGSTGNLNLATIEDLAQDALAGVEYLRSRKEIDPARVGLIGHSEGGLTGPLAATQSKDVAFVVMLAGPGVPGDEIVIRQVELLSKAGNLPDEQVAKLVELQKKIFALLRTDREPEALKEELKTMLAEQPALPGQPELEPDIRDKQIEAQVNALFLPSLRFFLQYDPRPALGKLTCPVLAIVGEKDVQVDPPQNVPEIDKALRKAGNRDFSLREMKGLNHLFQHASTGLPSEYGQIEETFAPEALAEVGDWIAERFLKDQKPKSEGKKPAKKP